MNITESFQERLDRCESMATKQPELLEMERKAEELEEQLLTHLGPEGQEIYEALYTTLICIRHKACDFYYLQGNVDSTVNELAFSRKENTENALTD